MSNDTIIRPINYGGKVVHEMHHLYLHNFFIEEEQRTSNTSVILVSFQKNIFEEA